MSLAGRLTDEGRRRSSDPHDHDAQRTRALQLEPWTQHCRVHVDSSHQDFGHTAVPLGQCLFEQFLRVLDLLEDPESANSLRDAVTGQISDAWIELPEAVSGPRSGARGLRALPLRPGR